MSNTAHPSTRLFLLLALFFTCCLLPACTTPRAAIASKGQIHQVGLVWLKNAGNTTQRQEIITAVHSFAREIPEVKSAIVGRTHGEGGTFSDASYDVCFILGFESEATRLRYNSHPVHEKAAREVFLPLSRKLLFYRFVSE